jgi:hypothetical protein
LGEISSIVGREVLGEDRVVFRGRSIVLQLDFARLGDPEDGVARGGVARGPELEVFLKPLDGSFVVAAPKRRVIKIIGHDGKQSVGVHRVGVAFNGRAGEPVGHAFHPLLVVFEIVVLGLHDGSEEQGLLRGHGVGGGGLKLVPKRFGGPQLLLVAVQGVDAIGAFGYHRLEEGGEMRIGSGDLLALLVNRYRGGIVAFTGEGHRAELAAERLASQGLQLFLVAFRDA